MKIALTLLLAGSVVVSAQAPRKDPLTKYRQLWEKSLVTIPPPPPPPEEKEVISELDDYVLGGWSKTSQGGYVVSLINTKDPKGRITIAPGMPNKGGYQVLDVERDPMNYKATKVLIQVGVDKKWIGYEDKFLTLQQPPAAKPATQKPAQNQKQRNPPMPTSNSASKPKTATERQPRVRRVPVPPKK